MKAIALGFGAFVGGLFLGYVAAMFAFFVFGLVKEALGNPKNMAIPALLLLSIFGLALVVLAGLVFQNWLLFAGAAITFAHGAQPLFRSEN